MNLGKGRCVNPQYEPTLVGAVHREAAVRWRGWRIYPTCNEERPGMRFERYTRGRPSGQNVQL